MFELVFENFQCKQVYQLTLGTKYQRASESNWDDIDGHVAEVLMRMMCTLSS